MRRKAGLGRGMTGLRPPRLKTSVGAVIALTAGVLSIFAGSTSGASSAVRVQNNGVLAATGSSAADSTATDNTATDNTAQRMSARARIAAPASFTHLTGVRGTPSTVSKPPAKRPAAAKQPATPKGLPKGIEPQATYVGQTACQSGFRPGTAALGRLLVSTYPGTSFGGDYACGSDGIISEHYEGRALDWMNSARIPAQAAQANAVLHWLLDPDKAGNAYANARRLGVMYVIWNNKIWGTWDDKWDPYENCAQTPSPSRDSFCHRNHIHISLSWDGAWGRTSFFSKQVFSATDFGPCRAKDLNWAAPYSRPNYTPCIGYPKLSSPKDASPVLAALTSWSGDVIGPGSIGPAVAAVQSALKVPITSEFDVTTARAVTAFKKAHRMATNAQVDAGLWRALKAMNPVSHTKPRKAKAVKAKPAKATVSVKTQPVKSQPVPKPSPTAASRTTPAPTTSATTTANPTTPAPATSAPTTANPTTPAPVPSETASTPTPSTSTVATTSPTATG